MTQLITVNSAHITFASDSDASQLLKIMLNPVNIFLTSQIMLMTKIYLLQGSMSVLLEFIKKSSFKLMPHKQKLL